IYLARPRPTSVDHPERWLAGWAAVRARPGETAVAQVRIPARALCHWDVPAGAWRTEAGPCRVLAGRSAGDLPLRLEVDVLDRR
ncbi:fibronectin type III-like domain-contianing protein, partial [Streptomyces sp. SAS_269]|uniref:fibronectin type III-like domain-contianing protein n=1 Tax=Streptomyces sp. SAS_269 TaxID=3412749 RepID=UPI00403CEB85